MENLSQRLIAKYEYQLYLPDKALLQSKVKE